MNLTTRYLNLELRSPLVVSASPLSERIDNIKQMEEAGAGAVVLYSLFEEQVRRGHRCSPSPRCIREPPRSMSRTVSAAALPRRARRLPRAHSKGQGVSQYPDYRQPQLQVAWRLGLNSAGRIEQAGADALELNIYFVPTDPYMTAEQAEDFVYISDFSSGQGGQSTSGSRQTMPVFHQYGAYGPAA